MEIKQIKIPNVADINFYRIGLIEEFGKNETIEVEDIVYFLSQYLDIEQETLEQAFITDLKNLYLSVLDSMQNFELPEIQNEITIEGQCYTFRADEKLPAIWFMTAQRVIAQGATLPAIAALCYVEEGKQFWETDFEKRKELFNKQLTYSTYAPLTAFFLEKWNLYQELFFLNPIEINQLSSLQLMKS